MKLTKDVLIDAIIGGCYVAPGDPKYKYCEKNNLGHWTGGFVDAWTWDRPGLEKLPMTTLKSLYNWTK